MPTSKKEVIHRHAYESAYAYAQVIKSGDLVFVSGTVSIDDEGVAISPGNMNEQVRVTYQGILDSLALVDLTMSDVIKETIHTTDLDAFVAALPIRAAFYAGHSLPATGAWHEVVKLAQPGLLVEVDVIARMP